MAVGANSYGTAVDVAALTQVYTVSGAYTSATTPTLSAVEAFLDRVSALMNSALAANGFTVPVTQADAKLAVSSFVIEAAADLAHAANAAGRFYTDKALERGVSPMRAIRREISDWVTMEAAGLAELGAARVDSPSYSIGYRDTDNHGNSINPIFQRSGFGNVFENWDGD